MNTTKQKSQEMNNDIYYRPPWTCGKYNAEKHVAIMFNLLSRMNYFYENESADVIGIILKAGRNGMINVQDVSQALDIAPVSISKFFQKLYNDGLLSKTIITNEAIEEYRNLFRTRRRNTEKEEKKFGHFIDNRDKTPYMAYANAVKDDVTILEAMFELTYRCSEKCIHCYNPGATRNDNERSGRADYTELSWAEYKYIIDDLCDEGLTTATISGGDPFSNRYAWDIIEYLHQKDIAVSILTNGLSISGYGEKLAALYPVSIQFSIYSGDAKVHDSITRVKGSWEKTIGVIDELHGLSIPIDIACPIIRTNLKSYSSVKPIMEKYGSNYWFDLMITDSNDGDKCVSHNLRLTPEQMEIVLLDQDVMQHVPIDNLNDDDSSSTIEEQKEAPCGAMYYSYCVNPSGILTPCCAFPMALGDLKKNKISTIVDNNFFVKNWGKTDSKSYEECFTHEYCDYCFPCPGNNFIDKGDPFKAGENNCYIAKIRYNTILKLKNGKDILHGKTINERINELKVQIPTLNREYENG